MGSHVVMPDAESCDCLSEWHLVYTQTASYRPEKKTELLIIMPRGYENKREDHHEGIYFRHKQDSTLNRSSLFREWSGIVNKIVLCTYYTQKLDEM